MDLTEFFELIPTLEKEDLVKAKTLIDFNLGLDSVVEPLKTDYHVEDEFIYMGICSALTLHLVIHPMPFSIFKKTGGGALLKKNAPHMREFVTNNFTSFRKTERIALYGLLSEMIVQHMLEYKIILLVPSVINNLSRIPSLFERQFPHYLESGLAVAMMKSRCQK